MSLSLSLYLVRQGSDLRSLTIVDNEKVMHGEEFHYDSEAIAKNVYETALKTFNSLGYQLVGTDAAEEAQGFQVEKHFEVNQNISVIKEYFKGLNEVFPDQFSHALEELQAVQI